MEDQRRPAVQDEALLASGMDVSAAAPRLRASWARSRQYGASLDEVEPVFTGSVDTGSLLYECGNQVLHGLQATLANEPISLMLADCSGLVLTRLCNDDAIRRSLDRVHLAPGFWFTERTAGTNGLGLSLADRAPSLVRADQHYCTALRGYTCAAVPVLDPITGELAGSVNLTTWSDSSSDLLLALAQAAAGNTAALMLVRAAGRRLQPPPRGEVFRVHLDRAADDGDDPCRSATWRRAVQQVRAATAAGRVVAVVGEPGSGRTTLASRGRPGPRRERVLEARSPALADDVGGWLALWTPELGAADTCIVVAGVESLPAWAADELAESFRRVRRPAGQPQPFVLTASEFAAIPPALAGLVDSVIEAPPLRDRIEDVLPLAQHVARRQRNRELTFTRRAAQALTAYPWPGNVSQLRRVIRDAAARADVIDSPHLAVEVFTGGGHPLTRLEVLERDEIIRCLNEPGTTVAQAAATLGMARATVYRKLAQYDIQLPGRTDTGHV